MDVKNSDPPEEVAETKKRKNRRGTRGKGRKINYNKDQRPPKTNKMKTRMTAEYLHIEEEQRGSKENRYRYSF